MSSGVQTVLVSDTSAPNALPIRIRLTFNVTGSGSDVTMTSATLDLERNDRVKPTAPVLIGRSDGSVEKSDLDYPNVSRQQLPRATLDHFAEHWIWNLGRVFDFRPRIGLPWASYLNLCASVTKQYSGTGLIVNRHTTRCTGPVSVS